MKIYDKKGVHVVRFDPEDIQRFNAEEHAQLPDDKEILFVFVTYTGEYKRVMPASTRQHTAWERMRDQAYRYFKENM